MQVFFDTLMDGLSLGSVYALVALGYTMVYGIAKMLNFAHGDIIMIGGYAVFVGLSQWNLSLPIVYIICILVCSLLGFSIEKLAYKPLRQASPLSVLITAIGVSYLLENLALLQFSSEFKVVTGVIDDIPNLKIPGTDFEVPGLSLLILGVTIVVMIVLTLFINKTKMGSAMLAVSEDKGAAQLMGVNVNRTISLTFIIGSALAGIASILYIAKYKKVDPYMGASFGIKAFAAAVFGGIGSVPGAMIGGLLIGLIESFAVGYLPASIAPASDGVAFAILILILVLKPSGLLGKKTIEKV